MYAAAQVLLFFLMLSTSCYGWPGNGIEFSLQDIKFNSSVPFGAPSEEGSGLTTLLRMSFMLPKPPKESRPPFHSKPDEAGEPYPTRPMATYDDLPLQLGPRPSEHKKPARPARTFP